MALGVHRAEALGGSGSEDDSGFGMFTHRLQSNSFRAGPQSCKRVKMFSSKQLIFQAKHSRR